VKQPWYVFSSSSGETFEKFYAALDKDSQGSLEGFFVDRDCPARARAERILGAERVHAFARKDFEAGALKVLQDCGHTQALIFLCGFFGILSENFLKACPHAILNTHPSLLPAYPGLDQKVHQAVFAGSHFGGFSLHLVNEKLDGGALIYQKATSLLAASSWEEARSLVREVEQNALPKVWPTVLEWKLSAADRHATTRELATRFPVATLY
jgi:phosphoribosylglycinamide formyltransferase-1